MKTLLAYIPVFLAGFVTAINAIGLYGYNENYSYSVEKMCFAIGLGIVFAGLGYSSK